SMDSTESERLDKLYHKTPSSYEEAVAIQKELQKMVIPRKGFKEIKRVAGADLAPIKGEERLVCGIIVFSYPGLAEIERVSAVVEEEFPYIPGLLAFREGPAIIEAFKKLKNKPDVLMIDGQGIAHPRGFGIACYVGVLLDISSVGVAKQRLYGKYDEPKDSKGNWTPLTTPHEGHTIGAVLRTKKRTKPVFVSIGHKIDLKTAVKISLQCSKGYRIPEPTRQADIFVAQLKTIVS
ncbi:MAG: deoxyribonuclease V, partial [Thermodesulfobacteriota bacterium]